MDVNRTVFGTSRALIPVVHVESLAQARRNAEIAWKGGADGIFLINHGMTSRELMDVHAVVYADDPSRWIGVNCLDLEPSEVFSCVGSDVPGIWVDDACINEMSDIQTEAERIGRARGASGWKGLYFGGVAFKYRRHVDDLASAARKARAYVDVVTTSGPGTGQAAELMKVAELRRALGDTPLALASGVTPENVGDYLADVDYFLVATGISRSFFELDPGRVAALAGEIHRWQPPAVERPIRSVCFVCEYNEGRSAHLAIRVRHALGGQFVDCAVLSAGLTQGARIGQLRQDFLRGRGIPDSEIVVHKSTVFGEEHARADLVLVAETQMAERLIAAWPGLDGRVMTIRGFAYGRDPSNDLSASEAHLEDAAGHSEREKLQLYDELESLAARIVERLSADK